MPWTYKCLSWTYRCVALYVIVSFEVHIMFSRGNDALITVHFLCYKDLLSDVGTVYESTWEAIRHVLNAHPQQNVSILLEKSQNTFIPRTYRLKGEIVECPASV